MNRKYILVPVNLDRARFDSVEFVAGLSAETAVCATLLHVLELKVSQVEARVYEELGREAKRRLQALAKQFFRAGSPQLSVRIGRAHEQILAEAAESNSELIVMAGCRIPRPKWRLCPTTVERVVREAPCLTLVLPRTWRITPEPLPRQAAGTLSLDSWR